jgi:hypothetical protein
MCDECLEVLFILGIRFLCDHPITVHELRRKHPEKEVSG